MTGSHSRNKGARGELEWAAQCRAEGWESARRGCQYSGGPDSPDVTCKELPFHFESKRTEKLSLYPAMQQAEADAPDGIPPVVVHRRNHHEWLVIMRAEDWFELVREAI